MPFSEPIVFISRNKLALGIFSARYRAGNWDLGDAEAKIVTRVRKNWWRER